MNVRQMPVLTISVSNWPIPLTVWNVGSQANRIWWTENALIQFFVDIFFSFVVDMYFYEVLRTVL